MCHGGVQLALPPLVGFLFTYALIRAGACARTCPIAALWPHGWPIWVQAVLMVLVVDFLRYWLHRAAHENDTLWRLHSVHHSVEQLYWLNTGAVPSDREGAADVRSTACRSC